MNIDWHCLLKQMSYTIQNYLYLVMFLFVFMIKQFNKKSIILLFLIILKVFR